MYQESSQGGRDPKELGLVEAMYAQTSTLAAVSRMRKKWKDRVAYEQTWARALGAPGMVTGPQGTG